MTLNPAPYDPRQHEYAKFSGLDQIPYSIVSYLIDNDELIWKLLRYDDADAWKSSKANLTKAQKGVLVWDGIRKIIDCRVFLDTGADDSWILETSMLRISVVETTPSTYVWGNVCIALDTYVHYKVNALSNYSPRNLMICRRLLEVLNGADVPGAGRLFFDAKAAPRSRMLIGGQVPYKGMSLMMYALELGSPAPIP